MEPAEPKTKDKLSDLLNERNKFVTDINKGASYDSDEIIMLMAPTGTGKTTICEMITNPSGLTVEVIDRNAIIKEKAPNRPTDSQTVSRIGTGNESTTEAPFVYVLKEEDLKKSETVKDGPENGLADESKVQDSTSRQLLLADMPGWDDTREREVSLPAMMKSRLFYKRYPKQKICFVLNYGDIFDKNGTDFLSQITYLVKTFYLDDQDRMAKNFILVVNKCLDIDCCQLDEVDELNAKNDIALRIINVLKVNPLMLDLKEQEERTIKQAVLRSFEKIFNSGKLVVIPRVGPKSFRTQDDHQQFFQAMRSKLLALITDPQSSYEKNSINLKEGDSKIMSWVADQGAKIIEKVIALKDELIKNANEVIDHQKNETDDAPTRSLLISVLSTNLINAIACMMSDDQKEMPIDEKASEEFFNKQPAEKKKPYESVMKFLKEISKCLSEFNVLKILGVQNSFADSLMEAISTLTTIATNFTAWLKDTFGLIIDLSCWMIDGIKRSSEKIIDFALEFKTSFVGKKSVDGGQNSGDLLAVLEGVGNFIIGKGVELYKSSKSALEAITYAGAIIAGAAYGSTVFLVIGCVVMIIVIRQIVKNTVKYHKFKRLLKDLTDIQECFGKYCKPIDVAQIEQVVVDKQKKTIKF